MVHAQCGLCCFQDRVLDHLSKLKDAMMLLGKKVAAAQGSAEDRHALRFVEIFLYTGMGQTLRMRRVVEYFREVVKQLGRNDVVYIWRGVLADGTMKFVRDTDSLQREADGTLVYDARSGLPLEVDPVTTVHRPAPVLWLAAAAAPNGSSTNYNEEGVGEAPPRTEQEASISEEFPGQRRERKL